MEYTSFVGLIENAGLLLAVAFIFDTAVNRLRVDKVPLWQVILGLILGTIGVAVMLTPWTFTPGIVFDTRSVLLGISGLFFGPLPTAIAMVMTASFRFYQGGTGALTGIAVILSSGVIGVLWRHFRRRNLAEISWRELYLFGIVIHLAMLLMMLTLPREAISRVLLNIALPVIVIYPLATALLGILLVKRLQHERTAEALRDAETRFRFLFEHSPDGILVIDPVTARPVHFNKSAHQQLGYSREDFSGLNLFDLEASEMPEETRAHIAKAMSEGRTDFDTEHRTQQGEIRNVHVTAQFSEISGKPLFHCIWRDITDRKLAQEALTRSEEKFRKAFYTSPDSVNINRLEDGMYVSINPGFTRIMGYTEEEIIGKTSTEYNIWNNLEDRQRLVTGLKRDGEVRNLEATFRTKDGDIRYGLMSASIIDLSGVPHILNITRDITDRKKAAEALKESEKQYRLLADNVNDVIFVLDMNLDYIYVSPSVEVLRGYEPSEVFKQPALETVTPASRDLVIKTFAEFMELEESGNRDLGVSRTLELEMIRKDGSTVWTEVKFSLIRDENQKPERILGVTRDIDDRKRAKAELVRSEEKFRTIFDRASDGILIADAGTKKFLQGNNAVYSMLGYTKEEIEGLSIYDIYPPEYRPHVLEDFEKQARGEKSLAENVPVMRKDRSIFYSDIASAPISIGGKDYLLGIFRDITERKLVDDALARAAKEWQTTFDATNDVIWILDKNHRILQSNKTAELLFNLPCSEIIGKHCWEIVHGTTKPIPHYPIIRAEKSLRREIMESYIGENWFEVTADPILNEAGQYSGAVHIVSDITERKKAEEQLRQTLETLRKTVETNIQVIVSAVEAKDPYTAGHQLRSADLARAIATEMQLPREKIDGIFMASSIHDIGKLSIPSEILSKPTKLLHAEFLLIKEHPYKGYVILKDIETDWPLAEIVYQHHERMDGSGYPRNLKGEEILIEARILAVADTVESMASHRPYRATLGIEAALKEISEKRGILYDTEVVDACLKLFQQKGYKLG